MASLSLRCSKDWNSLQERKSMRCSTTSVVLVLELSYLEFSVCKIVFRIHFNLYINFNFPIVLLYF